MFCLCCWVPETAQRERECKVREMRCAVAEEGLGFIGFNDNPFAPPMSPATLAARGAYEKCFGRRRGRVTARTQVDERSSRCLRGVAVCGLCRRGGARKGPASAGAQKGEYFYL